MSKLLNKLGIQNSLEGSKAFEVLRKDFGRLEVMRKELEARLEELQASLNSTQYTLKER